MLPARAGPAHATTSTAAAIVKRIVRAISRTFRLRAPRIPYRLRNAGNGSAKCSKQDHDEVVAVSAGACDGLRMNSTYVFSRGIRGIDVGWRFGRNPLLQRVPDHRRGD